MGYTHYFSGLTSTPEVLADATAIIDTAPVLICGPQGQGLPVLDETQGILLNGSAAAGESYETFCLPSGCGKNQPSARWFCTTANKPYDIVVTAILVAAALRCPGSLRSDGGLENWTAGIALFEKAVGPLTEDGKISLELDIEGMRPENR